MRAPVSVAATGGLRCKLLCRLLLWRSASTLAARTHLLTPTHAHARPWCPAGQQLLDPLIECGQMALERRKNPLNLGLPTARGSRRGER